MKRFFSILVVGILLVVAGSAICLAEGLTGDWITAGSLVSYGAIEQDNNFDNGAEPIEWIVLTSDGEYSFVVSKEVLALRRFTDRTHVEASWFGDEMDLWLNDTFLASAFTDEERGRIAKADYVGEESSPFGEKDNKRIFILSEQEFNSYLSETPNAIAHFTPFVTATAEAKIPKPGQTIYAEDMVSNYIRQGDRQTWWLRTGLPYVDSYDGGFGNPEAKIVVGEGILKSDSIGNNAGVRPAMWIKLGEMDSALMAMPEVEATSHKSVPQGDVTDWY